MFIDIVYLSNDDLMRSIPKWIADLIDIFFRGYPVKMNLLKRKSINVYNIDDFALDEKSQYTLVKLKTGKDLLVTDTVIELQDKINTTFNGGSNNTAEDIPGDIPK